VLGIVAMATVSVRIEGGSYAKSALAGGWANAFGAATIEGRRIECSAPEVGPRGHENDARRIDEDWWRAQRASAQGRRGLCCDAGTGFLKKLLASQTLSDTDKTDADLALAELADAQAKACPA
jgi:hypothetical protein